MGHGGGLADYFAENPRCVPASFPVLWRYSASRGSYEESAIEQHQVLDAIIHLDQRFGNGPAVGLGSGDGYFERGMVADVEVNQRMFVSNHP